MSNINATVIVDSNWGSGYGAHFSITNNNTYDIGNWSLIINYADTFSWISDVTVTKLANGLVRIDPADYIKKIIKGSTLSIGFGGKVIVPTNLQFTQLLPPSQQQIDDANSKRGIFGNKVFAPYTDILQWPIIDLLSIVNKTGQKFYTLAFIVADTNNLPSWGGIVPLSDQYFLDTILSLRLLGGDVIISFGGANGQELAQVINNPISLAQAYQSVIDMYQLKWIDFDIEGAAVNDKISIDIRNKALSIIRANNPGIIISYTLPVLPTGLTLDGTNLLANIKTNNLQVDVINAMSMDFGSSVAPNAGTLMGKYVINSATNTYAQVQSVGLTSKIGITPMIGVNDVSEEIFTLASANQVLTFANVTPYIRELSFWSVNRDNSSEGVLKWASSASSGIKQNPFDFTNIFKQYQ